MAFDPITRHHEGKAAQHSALLSALSGRPDEADSLMERTTTHDGGARQTPPAPPETHDRLLARLLSVRRADAGPWTG